MSNFSASPFLCLWIILCLLSVSGRKYDRKKSYSYQFVRRHYTNFADPDDFGFFDDDDEGTRWLCLVLGFCATTWHPGSEAQTSGISSQFEWSQLEFDYPSEEARQSAITSGDFNEGHPAPIDVDVYYSKKMGGQNKVFVTIPRFQPGVPATLGTVTDKMYKGNRVIAPYPSWSWHEHPEQCAHDRIISVYRVKVDECGRLWVLDTGRLIEKRICPAQILAFDLETNELLHRYEIPEDQLHSTSILVTPIVDVRDPMPEGQCKDTFVYAADCQAMALIVYDVKKDTSWQVIDKTMYPFPTFGTYKIAGEQFDLMDGVLGMDLSPYKPGQHDRVLFYHAMSSGTENWVLTSHLRNQSLFEGDPSPAPEIFHMYPDRRHTQAPAQAIDKDGISYFGLVSDTSINCWNTAADYGTNNIGIIAKNESTLQFPSAMKVITNKRGTQELWFVTMRFQKIAAGTLDTNEINYRIQAGNIPDLLDGSKCLNTPPGRAHGHGKGNHGNHHGNNGNQGNNGNHYGHQMNVGGYQRPSYGGSYGYTKNNNKRDLDRFYFPNY